MDFTFWNEIDPADFIRDDRDNKAREMAADVFRDAMPRGRRRCSLVEVGCGPGFDYADHFSKIKRLKYTGYDGAEAMVEHCRTMWPKGSFRCGGFSELAGNTWDFAYCKAVLEHQPDFRVPLQRLLRAATRLAIVNWYLPPSDDEAYARYSASERVHYNRYRRSDVEAAIDACGFDLEIFSASGSTNELYVCSPRG